MLYFSIINSQYAYRKIGLLASVRRCSVNPQMSTAEVLLDALDESRERLLMAIEPLEDEALLQKNVFGVWSITDVLSNITTWESELITGLMKLDQNKQPRRLLAAMADPNAYDQAHHDELQDRDLDQIFGDLQHVRIQLEDWLAEFSEKDLTNPKRYRWLNGRTLRSIIAQTTFKREDAFLPAIESFTETWLGERDDLGENVIPVSMVEPLTSEEKNDGAN